MDASHFVAKVYVGFIDFFSQRKNPICLKHQEVQRVLAVPGLSKQILIIAEH